jgi:hypothetical protein
MTKPRTSRWNDWPTKPRPAPAPPPDPPPEVEADRSDAARTLLTAQAVAEAIAERTVDQRVSAAVAAEMARRDRAAKAKRDRQRAETGGVVIVDRTGDPPIPWPEPLTDAERAEVEAHRLAVEVHGSEAALHEHEVDLILRQRAAEALLGCRWCGAQAVTFTPRDPARRHGQGPLRGLPIEPEGLDGRDRFDVRADTKGLCAECAEHEARGDLAVAVGRVVLERSGADGDDALDPLLAAAICASLPDTHRRAREPWAWLSHKRSVEVVAEARAAVKARRERALERCDRCGGTPVRAGRAIVEWVDGPTGLPRSRSSGYERLCRDCLRASRGA